jgi:FlgD Ig-like domain
VLHLNLEHSGVATDNSTNVHGTFFFEAEHDGEFAFVSGDAWGGNGSTFGTEALASYAGGSVNQTVSFTTTIPVAVPIGMHLNVFVATLADSPAVTDGYFAGEIGNASGHVMDLPAGYTVNSPTWGVVNNVSTGNVAGVWDILDNKLVILERVTPNPSAGDATISYAQPQPGDARLEVIDVQGRLIRTIASGYEAPGIHRLAWDGCDEAGQRVSAGLYFMRLEYAG